MSEMFVDSLKRRIAAMNTLWQRATSLFGQLSNVEAYLKAHRLLGENV